MVEFPSTGISNCVPVFTCAQLELDKENLPPELVVVTFNPSYSADPSPCNV